MSADEIDLKKIHEMFGLCQPAFVAMGDEIRQKLILDIIDGGDAGVNVMTLTSKSHLSRPAISHHLKVLKDAKLIIPIKHGTQVFYKMSIEQNLKFIGDMVEMLQKIMDKVKASRESAD